MHIQNSWVTGLSKGSIKNGKRKNKFIHKIRDLKVRNKERILTNLIYRVIIP